MQWLADHKRAATVAVLAIAVSAALFVFKETTLVQGLYRQVLTAARLIAWVCSVPHVIPALACPHQIWLNKRLSELNGISAACYHHSRVEGLIEFQWCKMCYLLEFRTNRRDAWLACNLVFHAVVFHAMDT